ncbi:uncharacterized mitochondrial protein AtMg00810-like [Helianthus annuus]|uniref:uncharacterized mitochondrial protein AtMg00810-like n=1 Tax=Helianthus annuus TaxID=4232 RepID=UPI000B904318|nr:uncharacterized mitochondrial protein AtMg00810-like [Helianthus annuus]
MTLFTKRIGEDVMLVQIYVDDIIFGSTNEELCKEFETVMKAKFEMSMMGELMLFLGFEVKQKEDGFLIHQAKYIRDILAKYNMNDCKVASTPFTSQTELTLDPQGKPMNKSFYRSMIGSLMYLIASRPDIMWAFCCKVDHRFQQHGIEKLYRMMKNICAKIEIEPMFPFSEIFDFEAFKEEEAKRKKKETETKKRHLESTEKVTKGDVMRV